MGETTRGAKRLGGERETGRNDSEANGKVGETTRVPGNAYFQVATHTFYWLDFDGNQSLYLYGYLLPTFYIESAENSACQEDQVATIFDFVTICLVVVLLRHEKG